MKEAFGQLVSAKMTERTPENLSEQLSLTPAQHINFGRSHFPKKIPPKSPKWCPQNEFREFPGPGFSGGNSPQTREVLHGVGADGVGVKFPTLAVNCCCSSLSFGRRGEKAKKNEEKRKKTKKCVKKAKTCVKKRGKSLRPHLHQPH